MSMLASCGRVRRLRFFSRGAADAPSADAVDGALPPSDGAGSSAATDGVLLLSPSARTSPFIVGGVGAALL